MRKCKHGMVGTREYNSWQSMKGRCNSENNVEFHRYGARGISVCEEWQNDFSKFYEDMGQRPAGHTLDRIDGNDGYYKNNCRWATPKEQSNNIKSNVVITWEDISMSVQQWADVLEIKPYRLFDRLKRGKSIEDVLFGAYEKRLNKMQVFTIKTFLDAGFSIKDVADKCGIKRRLVERIKYKEAWGHLWE